MIRVGIIGTGRVSRKHINGLLEVSDAKITAICDVDEEKLASVGDELAIPSSHRFTDYNELLACADVDAVEICTPNHLHVPIAIAAIKAGKAVEIEKPLSTCYEHGVDDLLALIEETGATNMMCFSYRFMPAVRYAKHLIESGKLGKIVNVSVEYLQSGTFIPGRKLEWRFVKEYAGSGTLGDLGVHLIDMTRFLIGDFRSVYGMSRIVVKERQKIGSDEIGLVNTDDLTGFMARLDGDVIANFLVTKCAIGESNTIKYEVFGTDGVIKFNLNDPEKITIAYAKENKTDGEPVTYPVPEEYRLGQEECFIKAVNGEISEHYPCASEGAKCQRIVDAILKSAEENVVVSLI